MKRKAKISLEAMKRGYFQLEVELIDDRTIRLSIASEGEVIRVLDVPEVQTLADLFNEIGYDDDDIRMDLDEDTPSGRPHDPATCPDCNNPLVDVYEEADYEVFKRLMDRWIREQ